MAAEVAQISQAAFVHLYKNNIIPLRVVGKLVDSITIVIL